MIDNQNGERRPENNSKNLNTTPLVEDLCELIDFESEDAGENFWDAREGRIVNLFAGNLNETVVFFKQLVERGQSGWQITAVDLEEPTNDLTNELDIPERFSPPEFVLSDAFKYLQDAPNDSIDVLTAYGAEFLFLEETIGALKAMANLKTFYEEVRRTLREGGYVQAPYIADQVFGKDPEFRKVMRDVYQRLPSSSERPRSQS